MSTNSIENNPKSLYLSGLKAYRQKKYPQAFEFFKTAAEFEETKIEAIQMIAIMFAGRQTPVLLCCYGNAEQIALQS